MATFVIETYLSRARAAELDEAIERLRAAAVAPARHIRSVFVPEDETCFHVIEGPSLDVVRAVSVRAGLRADRIVRARSVGERLPKR